MYILSDDRDLGTQSVTLSKVLLGEGILNELDIATEFRDRSLG